MSRRRNPTSGTTRRAASLVSTATWATPVSGDQAIAYELPEPGERKERQRYQAEAGGLGETRLALIVLVHVLRHDDSLRRATVSLSLHDGGGSPSRFTPQGAMRSVADHSEGRIPRPALGT
jgi:hypothetical protein